MAELRIDHVDLTPGRPHNWRTVYILVLLYLFGNLASVPFLRATHVPVEPAHYWMLYTGLSFLITAIAEFLAGRSGLRAPLLEGQIKRDELSWWCRRVFGLSLSIAVVGSLPFLLLNLDANPERVPASWKMALASVDAGIQEEIFYRFFLLSSLVWLGGLMWKTRDGQPTQRVFWGAIIVSGIIFGWSHIDDKISNPQIQASPEAFMKMMLVSTVFGIIFGWLYWKQGLESAILAHSVVDAVGMSIVIPAYLSDNYPVQVAVLLGLVLLGFVSCLLLMGGRSRNGAQGR